MIKIDCLNLTNEANDVVLSLNEFQKHKKSLLLKEGIKKSNCLKKIFIAK